MLLKILLLAFGLGLASLNVYAQLPEMIEQKSSDIFLSFTKDKIVPQNELDSLNTILNSKYEVSELTGKYHTTKNSYDSLINHFQNYLAEIKDISTDSSLVLFNYWYLHYSNTFYKYNKQKFFSTDSPKIILFSTSMSCHCTLEMCKNQTIQLLDFIRKNNDYQLWVIDSYEHSELQIEYETLFSPSVVVFDSKNNVKTKIEYEEDMITQFIEYHKKNK